MAQLNQYRAEYGRADEPFTSLVGVKAEPNRAVFESLLDSGMSAGLNMPFAFALGVRSSLDDKKRMMERFANDVILHF